MRATLIIGLLSLSTFAASAPADPGTVDLERADEFGKCSGYFIKKADDARRNDDPHNREVYMLAATIMQTEAAELVGEGMSKALRRTFDDEVKETVRDRGEEAADLVIDQQYEDRCTDLLDSVEGKY